MMKTLALLLSLLLVTTPLTAETANTFLDYQNYNHGYCPDCTCAPCACNQGQPPAQAPCDTCNQYDPCAPACGTQCGISYCAIGIAVVAVGVAALIIAVSGSGSSSVHN